MTDCHTTQRLHAALLHDSRSSSAVPIRSAIDAVVPRVPRQPIALNISYILYHLVPTKLGRITASMPQVFSSIKEAWKGVIEGKVPSYAPPPPNARRRNSCMTDAPRTGDTRGLLLHRTTETPLTTASSSSHTADGGGAETADDATMMEEEDCPPFYYECSVLVKLADDDPDYKKEVDLSSYTDDQLRELKRTDPFLYYSIPAVRRMSYRDNVDVETAALIRTARSTTSRRSSMPADVLMNADIARSRQGGVGQDRDGQRAEAMIEEEEEEEEDRPIVRRRGRHSTEAHPTLVLEELMRELDGEGDLDGDNDDEDDDDGLDEEDLDFFSPGHE